MLVGRHQVPARTEVAVDHGVRREEPLGLSGRLEALHLPLAAPRRSVVEADLSRWKRVIGDALRFQTDGRQATEVAIAADALNRKLELGRPEYVRIA